MSRSKRFSPAPANSQAQLQIIGAMATERLMEVHFRYAMELVQHARDQIEPSRALAIYARLHDLRGIDAENLQHRVFVAIGRGGALQPPEENAAGEVEREWKPANPQALLAVIRRRLRGRVNSALREWVEYHTGRAETELLWAHVENALDFVELLEPGGDVGDAVATYASELAIPPARTETIYYLTLAHLSGNPLVGVPEDASSDDPRSAEGPGRYRPSLRIIAGHSKGRRNTG